MHFETPHNKIECVLSVKESNFNKKKIKFSHLVTVLAEVANPPSPNSLPDNKISAPFDTFPQGSHKNKRIFYGQADLRVAPSLTVSFP